MTRIEIVERTATLIGLRGLTERTTNDYLRKCRKLLDWIDLLGIQYDEVTYEQLLQYILYLKNDLDYAPRTINSTISFIRFLFLYVFNRPFDAYTLPRCKIDTTIPDILSRKEVGLFLNSIKNPKYRAVFAVMYSCGLRVREVCALRYEDVSRERMKVHIRHGKNRSDRLVPISQAALNILTQYWYTCGKPRGWLFPGLKPDTHITVNSVQRILKDTLKDLGWDDRKITSHTFRHSLGTHLYEETHDLVYVQNFLGHKSVRSTTIYITLLKGSFIPDKPFRELRHLTRYRKSVVHDITAQKNRIDKFLQSSGFRFTAFLSDAFGASGRNIIRHLIEHGSIDREALDKCLKTKTRNRIDEILVALNGSLSVHQRRFLNMVFLHLEELEAHRHTVEDEITEEVLKHTDALNLLCSIPGIDVTVAAAIVAEIGTDMSAFPDSQHICSWAGLSPGNNESAGKRKSVHINKGNPYLKSMLCETAWIMASHRKLYLSGWYCRVKQRKGAKRATIALARKILSIIYTMLKTGTLYNEECFEQRRLRCERKRANRLVNELQKLGYMVVAPG